MVQREQAVVSHRISHHAMRVWCVWVWLCACPLMGAATQFSSGQRRLAIWICHSVVLAVGAAFPGCFLGGGGSGRRCCFPRLLLGRRRFRPSVLLSPAASWAEEVPAVGAAFPGCFLGGGGSGRRCCFPRLLLWRRRELGPSVCPAARIHGGHVHDSTPTRRCHQG
ncbi:hypothetical protein ACQJBY_040081 [Aegilops geniculata]